MFEPYVTGLMWFDTLPDKKAVIDAFDLWTFAKAATVCWLAGAGDTTYMLVFS